MPNDSNAQPVNTPAAPATVTTPAAPAAAAPAPANAPAAPAAAPTPAPAADPTKTDPATPAAPAKADDGQKTGAPEQYEPFKAPEGVTLDDTVMTQFQTSAKKLGLSQEAAQNLINDLTPTINKQTQANLERQMQETRTSWETASKADTEFGGEKFDENLSVAKKTLETFGTPELKKLLDDSGIGSHPELLRWAFRVGKQIKPDDRHVQGGNANGAAKDARSFYPNSNHAS